MATGVIDTPASAAKTVAASPWTICLRFGLIDGQRSSAHVGPVERRDGLVGFTGIAHFDKPETTGAARLPVGHETYFFHRALCLKQAAQVGFGCAVGQVSNVQVLHRNSSFSKSSRLVALGVCFDGRPSESRGRSGKARIAWVRASDLERTAEIRRDASRMPQLCG